jgi:hypothetical protein
MVLESLSVRGMAGTWKRRCATATRRWLLPLGLLGLAACGGGGADQNPTPRCLRASDCTGALVCIQGFCVQECTESKDCPTGERCIPATGGNSCQPPEKSTCTYTSECIIPLVCGLDQQCRAQCQSDVDCPHNQHCTSISKLCADPTIDKNYDPVTNEFVGTLDGGSLDTAAPPPVDAGVPPDASLPQPDVALPGPDLAAVDAPPVYDTAPADTGGSGSDVPLSYDAPALLVDGVTVTPSPSARQGQINLTLTINRAAGGLATAGLFDMGDLTVRPQTGSSDFSLILKVSVPHGAPLGKRTLRFATSGGVVTVADAVEVTAITAGPSGDDANAGSTLSPFLTFKQAILVADVGDTIRLMDGTYNAKGGETWGYVIPDRLTVVGDSTANTIIDGVGATSNPNGFNASTNLTLKTLTLQHFYYGIDMKQPSSTLSLQDVILGGNGSYGIYVEQTATGSTVNVTGKNGLIDQPGQAAIAVYNAPSVTVNVADATLQGGYHVIYFASNCSGSALNLSGATIKQLANDSAVYLGVYSNPTATTATIDKATIIGNVNDGDAKGSMTITGSTITQKYGNGIDFSGASLTIADTSIAMAASNDGIYFNGPNATMSLEGVTITGGGYGIQQTGTGSSGKLRGTNLSGTTYDTYRLQAGDLDLGTATESGDNVLGAPSGTSYWCLNISRPQGATAGNPVTCSGTTLNGLAPSPGTIDATAGAVSLQPQRYYLSTGNQLIFY